MAKKINIVHLSFQLEFMARKLQVSPLQIWIRILVNENEQLQFLLFRVVQNC